jgi:hypothetical protein
MIKVNLFSGRVYTETENFIQSNTGDTFVKSGDMWIGEHGELIQQRDDELLNIGTGISSNFGDPFKDNK